MARGLDGQAGAEDPALHPDHGADHLAPQRRDPTEGGQGEMFVFYRDLKPSDLGFVLEPTEEYPYANILGASDDDPDAARFRGWVEEKLGSAASLGDLLALPLEEWEAQG